MEIHSDTTKNTKIDMTKYELKAKEKLAERIDYSGEMLNPRAHSILIFKFIILSLYRTSLSKQVCKSLDNYFRTELVGTLLLMYVHYKPS